MISILVPTRGRPEQFKRMVDSARATSTNQPLIFSYQSDTDYPRYGDYKSALIYGEDYPTVYKWNFLAERALASGNNINLFMLGADDMIFATPGWDTALINHYNKLENKIHCYALQDSRDPEGTPHPIVTREYIEAMGYAFHPIFLHWQTDTWTTKIAKANKVFTHLRDYLLIHDKPSDRNEPDDTHNHIRSMGWRQRDAYVNDTCQHLLQYEKERLGKTIAKQFS